MKVLVIKPENKPQVQEIDGTLESMQSLVGGTIQAIYPFEDQVALICNDEGKLLHLQMNRALRDEETGKTFNILCGTVFLCGAPAEEPCFTDLSEEQIQKYTEMFYYPEYFWKTNQGMFILRMEE